MTAFLPQHDPRRKQRDHELANTQGQYQYNHDYVSPLALVDNVPAQDHFSLAWIIEVGKRALTILRNHVEVEADLELRKKIYATHSRFHELIESLALSFDGVVQLIEEAFGAAPNSVPMDGLGDYAEIFRTIELPPIARDYQQDAVFAEMRLAGPNPVLVQRLARLDGRFPVTNADYQKTLKNDSLDAALAEGRLYLVDYAFLADVKNGSFPDAQKYLYAPLALFAVDAKSHRFVPIAIQCKQDPGPDNPVFTPDDGVNWLIAKTIVEVADGNYHEAITHLGRTHLFLEPFVIATQRQLAANHPLGILLRPHFQFTLAINDYAYKHLINDGGPVDELLGGTIGSTRGLTANGIQKYAFNDALPLKSFTARGVDDASLLPNYPYRDDALLYWNAIRQWVGDYLRIYYQSDADVQGDEELANWFRELVARDGGRVPGLGENGSIGGLNYLIDAVTFIVFTASVQHAAVNFPQYDLMSYVPNMPLACMAQAPTKKSGGAMEDYLAILPRRRSTGLQLSLGYLLGTIHYTQLGEYGRLHFDDNRVAAPLQQFQKQVENIGKTIDQRNAQRRPYTYLVPSGIPQSINI